MSERDRAWRTWSDARPDDDEVDPVSFTAGYDAGHASAEAKYAPALSAAEAERDLRKWLLDEASGNGPAVNTTAGPTAATNTWRYPYWPAHDVAWEEER